MTRKTNDLSKFKAYDFSNLSASVGSGNCYGTCNDNSCDIYCDCVCDSDWGWDSFERESKKEAQMALARQRAREHEYSEKTAKDEKETIASNEFDKMSEEELLNLIQSAMQALAARRNEHKSR